MIRRTLSLCAVLFGAGVAACGGDSGGAGNALAGTGCLNNAQCSADGSLVCCASAKYTCVAAAQCASSAGACSASPTIVSGGTVQAPQPPAGTCTKDPKSPSLAASQVQNFPGKTVGDVVPFSVAAGTGSVTVVEQAVQANDAVVFKGQVIENSAVPLNVIAPDGTKLYDDTTCCDPDGGDPSQQYPVFFGGGGANTLALTIPNATLMLSAEFRDGGLPVGTWKMTVNDYARECVGDPNCSDGGSTTGKYNVSVLTKPGLPTTGQLDVGIYLVSSSSAALNNTTAPGNPAMQRFVQTLSSFYAQVGICVRTVTVYDVPTWAQNQYGSNIDADKTSPCSALDQMLTLSTPANALDLFMVQSIISSRNNGQSVVGIDGTIPGPASIGGTVHSGAAVSLSDLGTTGCTGPVSVGSCGPDSVAYIAAHEGGHYMGLFHTSEASGRFFDPLTDTETCRCDTCVPPSKAGGCNNDGSGTQVLPQNCRRLDGTCGGGDDLMFWIFDQTAQGKLTPQQGQVMRLNPVVQ